MDYSVSSGPFKRFSMRFEFLSEMFDHSVCETRDPSLTIFNLQFLKFFDKYLSTTEALHPLIVLGVLREAIVMHGGPGWRLYHAAMTRHLEDDGEAEEDDSNENVDVRDEVRHL